MTSSTSGNTARTYRELWEGLQETALDYEAFYKLFPPHGDPDEMLSHLLESSPTISPMGILLLVSPVDGDHVVVPIHSVEKVRAAGQPLWKLPIGVEGEHHPLMSGLTMRRLDGIAPTMFTTLQDVLVPTVSGFCEETKDGTQRV